MRETKEVVLDCKFYIPIGKCSSKDAPNPGHSLCIGKDGCGSYHLGGGKVNEEAK